MANLKNRSKFEKELISLISRYSQENVSETPDFVLAEYIMGCMKVYEQTVKRRDEWFGFNWSESKF